MDLESGPDFCKASIKDALFAGQNFNEAEKAKLEGLLGAGIHISPLRGEITVLQLQRQLNFCRSIDAHPIVDNMRAMASGFLNIYDNRFFNLK